MVIAVAVIVPYTAAALGLLLMELRRCHETGVAAAPVAR
jgi:hypothetical protein